MVTIVVPTYNEENNIKKIQKNLDKLKGDFQVIFSDGFSQDNTYDLISINQRTRKIRETKFRSNQMNSASRYADGKYIWFIHADSILHENSILAIENSDADVGCFKLKFDSPKIMLKIIAYNSNKRVIKRNIAFGDQGIFIKKDLFDKIGGYESIPIMEDYNLSIRVKDMGIKFKQINLPIITSARRFLDKGIYKTMIRMQILQYKYRHGYNIEKIHSEYEK